jgi:hypothetical protein
MKMIIALVAVALGIFSVVIHPEGLSPAAAIQVVICVGGGAIYLLITVAQYVMSLPKRVVASKVLTPVQVPVVKVTKMTTPTKPQDLTGILSPNNAELYDNVSLIHIRNRLRSVGCKEGLELCTKLASIIFELDDAEDKSSPEGQTPDVKTKVSV